MATKITFTTSGGAAVETAQERINKKSRQGRQELQLTGREARKLGQLQQQVLRSLETDWDRYQRKLREAKIALAGHPREIDLVARAEQKLRQEYDASITKQEALNQKRKAAADAAHGAQQQLNTVTGETTGKFDSLGQMIGSVFSPQKLLAYAGGFVGIHQAVQLITSELQAQQTLIDKRNARQLSVAESRNRLLRNLDEGDPAAIRAAQQAAIRIARDTGLSEVAINAGLESAVSSTSGNVPLSIELVTLAARYLKDRPEEIGDFAGSLADLTRVTRSTDPNAALGLLRRTGQLSRITSARLQARNIAPALIGLGEFGGDARTSGALFSAITTGSADVKGEQTVTAVIQLGKQLEQFALGKGAFERDDPVKALDDAQEEVRRAQIAVRKASDHETRRRARRSLSEAQTNLTAAQEDVRLAGPLGELAGLNLLGRIERLQRNPELARAFLDVASFEAKALGPIRALIGDPTSLAARDFAANLQRIPDTAGLSQIGTRSLGIFAAHNELEPVAERGRRLASGLERLQLRRPEDRLSTAELEIVRDIAQETGSTALGAKFDELISRVSGGIGVSTGEAVRSIEGRIGELQHPQVVSTLTLGEATVPVFTPREPTAGEKEQAAILRDVVKELQEANRSLRRRGGIPVGGD